jgi:hypothetical protein
MAQIVQTDDEFTIVAPPIRLVFRWDGRRWAHELSSGGRVIASSVEWEPERDDPSRVVSPAYQQVSPHMGSERAGALLVGQWGPHHGSAVFTVSDDENGVVIAADVAVRSRSVLEVLACTYTVHLSSSDLIDASPSAIDWRLDEPPGGRLRFETSQRNGTGRVGLAEAGRRSTRVQASAEIVAGTATRRLEYRWRWFPDPPAP